jgi:hypothetical protein
MHGEHVETVDAMHPGLRGDGNQANDNADPVLPFQRSRQYGLEDALVGQHNECHDVSPPSRLCSLMMRMAPQRMQSSEAHFRRSVVPAGREPVQRAVGVMHSSSSLTDALR